MGRVWVSEKEISTSSGRSADPQDGLFSEESTRLKESGGEKRLRMIAAQVVGAPARAAKTRNQRHDRKGGRAEHSEVPLKIHSGDFL